MDSNKERESFWCPVCRGHGITVTNSSICLKAVKSSDIEVFDLGRAECKTCAGTGKVYIIPAHKDSKVSELRAMI